MAENRKGEIPMGTKFTEGGGSNGLIYANAGYVLPHLTSLGHRKRS